MPGKNGGDNFIFTRTQNLNLYPQVCCQGLGSIQVALQVRAIDRRDIHLAHGLDQGLCSQASLVIKFFSERISITMARKDDGRGFGGGGSTGLRVSECCTASRYAN